jgi:uncharacterized membrane protein YhiD involved in acid resistance
VRAVRCGRAKGLEAACGVVHRACGAIIKGEHEVAGVSTAVGVWITAGIGVATAYGHYTVGIVLSLCTLATLRLLRTPKDDGARRDEPGRR